MAGTAQPLRRAPNWLRRPAAATFGFGGKLVSVSNARRTLQGGEAYDSRLITISQVRGGLDGGGGPCGSSPCSCKLSKGDADLLGVLLRTVTWPAGAAFQLGQIVSSVRGTHGSGGALGTLARPVLTRVLTSILHITA